MNRLILSVNCLLLCGLQVWASTPEVKPPLVGETNKPVTFTTKDGKHYDNARVSVTDAGLSVLTPDGGASVPFNQLPDDLSAFPQLIRKVVADRRKSGSELNNNPSRSEESPEQIRPNGVEQLGNSKQPNSAAEANPASPLTNFEKDLIANFTAEEIQAHKMRWPETEYLCPTFSDNFPKIVRQDGKSVAETIQFINHKLQNSTVLYYDANWRTFVVGQIAFTSSGRIWLIKFPVALFDPADMNPDKIDKTRQDYGSELVGINTTNNKKSVTSVPITGTIVLQSTGVNFPVADDDADSVGRALIHLIRLYGGKSEDF